MNKKDESFKDFVLDQLAGLGDIDARRMFGSSALYHDEICFAVASKGRLYFRIDESTIGEYSRQKKKA